MHSTLLKVSCPDRVGLLARIANFVAEQGGNLKEVHQFTDPAEGWFFSRMEIETHTLRCDVKALRDAFDATMKDRQFIAEAKKMTGLDVIAMTGEQVEGIAKRIAMTPKEIVDKTVSMIGTFGD